MQERNVISGVTAAFTAPLVEGWDVLLPFFYFALVLTFVDLRFGILAAKKRCEKIRSSRAIRRTLNKIVDFISYLSIAWLMGHTFVGPFNIPLLPFAMLAIVYGIEGISCWNNFLEYKGINKKVSFFKVVKLLFKKVNVEDILEDAEPKKE